MRTFRASLKTLIGSLRKSGLAAYTRNPLANGYFLHLVKILNTFWQVTLREHRDGCKNKHTVR